MEPPPLLFWTTFLIYDIDSIFDPNMMIAPSFQLSGPITGSLLLLLRAINPGDTWAGLQNPSIFL